MNGKCEVEKSILSHDREIGKQDFKDKLKNEYRHKKPIELAPTGFLLLRFNSILILIVNKFFNYKLMEWNLFKKCLEKCLGFVLNRLLLQTLVPVRFSP